MNENFLNVISQNLKLLRNQKNLSLTKTANLCGLSKSMIAQIERIEVNPTISTIEKIADGFGISIIDLLFKPQPEIQFYPKDSHKQTASFDKNFVTTKIISRDTDRHFEHNIIEIESGGNSVENTTQNNSFIYLSVFKGAIIITINDDTYNMSVGDMIKFKSSLPYSISNTGKKSCRLSQIIHFNKL